MHLFSRLFNAEIWLACGETVFNNMKGLWCGKTDEAGRKNYSWFICKLMRGWFSGHIAIAALVTKLNNGARLSTKKFAFHIWGGDCVLVYGTGVCTWGNTCWLEISFLSSLCCWCVCVTWVWCGKMMGGKKVLSSSGFCLLCYKSGGWS